MTKKELTNRIHEIILDLTNGLGHLNEKAGHDATDFIEGKILAYKNVLDLMKVYLNDDKEPKSETSEDEKPVRNIDWELGGIVLGIIALSLLWFFGVI